MRPRLSVKGSTRPPSQSICTPRETRRKALTPPRASLAITRSRWSPATTARKWAATRRVSSSTRTITSGDAVAHEALGKYLKGIDQSSYTEYLSPTEHKIWDNWPFLLIFAALLTMEWWLRKRHGWV